MRENIYESKCQEEFDRYLRLLQKEVDINFDVITNKKQLGDRSYLFKEAIGIKFATAIVIPVNDNFIKGIEDLMKLKFQQTVLSLIDLFEDEVEKLKKLEERLQQNGK